MMTEAEKSAEPKTSDDPSLTPPAHSKPMLQQSINDSEQLL